MDRKILKATEGMLLTNGDIYGAEIYLAKGADEGAFYEIPESEITSLEEATAADYENALLKLGVGGNE